MKKIIIVSIIISALLSLAYGQQNTYWQQTQEAPTQFIGQGNNCIAANGNTIFVGTMRGGLYRSMDKGKSWENVIHLTDSAIEKVVTGSQDKIYAIATTELFISEDNGDTWERKALPAQYYLSDIEVLPDGTILVSSAAVIDVTDEEYDYFGDGILRSTDGGETWQAINTGIGYNKAINNIARSSTGILVASMLALHPGRGGLYYSSNNGHSWQQLNTPKYLGLKSGQLIAPTSIYEILCLEFDRNDNLYFSYEGIVNGNTGAKGGMMSPIGHVLKDSLWRPMPVTQLGYEWDYHPFHSIHLARKNDHLYVSLNRFGSQSYTGAYVKKANGEFQWIKDGIDDVLDSYLKVLYAEDTEGRIYAVQLFDHKVYYTDSSASAPTTGVNEKNIQSRLVQAFPNPATDVVTISCIENGNRMEQVNIYDLSGKRCTSQVASGMQVQVNTAHLPVGFYLLEVQTAQGLQRSRLVIGD